VTDPRSEIGTAARLTGRALGWLATTTEEVHAAVASRVFGLLGPPAVPVRAVHDSISTIAYGSVRLGLHTAGQAIGAVSDRHPALASSTPLSETPRGVSTVSAITGILGESVTDEHPELDTGMQWRHRGQHLTPIRDSLTTAYPDASRDLTVFVHGLCESEAAWWYRGRAHRAPRGTPAEDRPGPPRSLGEHLAEAHQSTPLYLRYNTGAHISDNGARLAQLLDQTVTAWPTEVRTLSLVGHSMGGLVLRSACHHALEAGHDWPHLVRHVVYLGTPHLGAPLEKAVNLAGWALRHAPETRPFADLLGRRSSGVRDLRFGYLVADEWEGHDPDHLTSRHVEVPLVEWAQHHVVTATLTRRVEHPIGWALGDLLVRNGSGAGRSRRREIGFADEVVTLGGRDHFDLLTDPEIADLLLDRLDPDAPHLGRLSDVPSGRPGEPATN
jgi:hypothetical protein